MWSVAGRSSRQCVTASQTQTATSTYISTCATVSREDAACEWGGCVIVFINRHHVIRRAQPWSRQPFILTLTFMPVRLLTTAPPCSGLAIIMRNKPNSNLSTSLWNWSVHQPPDITKTSPVPGNLTKWAQFCKMLTLPHARKMTQLCSSIPAGLWSSSAPTVGKPVGLTLK